MDEDEYKKSKMLEAIKNRESDIKAKRGDAVAELAKKRPEMMRGERKPSGSAIFEDVANDKQGIKIQGGPDKIDTNQVQKISTPKDVQNKAAIHRGTKQLNQMKKAAEEAKDAVSLKRAENALAQMYKKADKLGMTDVFKKGMKAVPIIGGIASALSSGDAAAAIPILDAEGLGDVEMSEEEGQMIEDTDPTIGLSKQLEYNQLADQEKSVDEAEKLQQYIRKQALLSKIR